jgi:hypothetical protein
LRGRYGEAQTIVSMSAFEFKSDIAMRPAKFRFVPKADVTPFSHLIGGCVGVYSAHT